MEPLSDALQVLGKNRVQATLLAHLLSKGASDTKSIISATGLRQPEVSIGIRALEKDWLDVQPIPREGKGRPMHQYDIRDRDALLAHLEEAARHQAKRVEDAIGLLKS